MKPLFHAVTALVLLAMAVKVLAVTEPPKRMVDGVTVDLSPLLAWRKSHQGDRPLTRWVELKGSIVGTNGLGWVLFAHAGGKTSKETKVILKNPPQAEGARYALLAAQLEALKQERARFQAEANQPLHDRKVRTRRGTRVLRDPNHAEVKDAKAQLADVNQRVKVVEKELAQLPSQNGRYVVDCLALQTGTVAGGLPVFDRGAIVP
ncbi:MAG TPA: hypothetical protein VFV96_02275 [Verrucomicrobiae bacterium]|nr:hypothetical protein [Verrucomicrobiae bacterium]